MKICICCSLTFTDEVKIVAQKLREMGHEVLLPQSIIEDAIHDKDFDPVKQKTKGCDRIRLHIDKIRQADAVLVCNYTKNDVENYIGANTFLEIAFAYYYKKPIYALNPLPDQPYIHDEIAVFGISVLNGKLENIK